MIPPTAAHALTGIRLIIADADGTLRRTTVEGQPCPFRPDQWELLPGVNELLSQLDWDRVMFGIASNQDQVAYGGLTLEAARTLLLDLARAATGRPAVAAIIELCPHRAEDNCQCRKPACGMLRSIMERTHALAHETLFIGDDAVDREAALRAGVRFIWAENFFGTQA